MKKRSNFFIALAVSMILILCMILIVKFQIEINRQKSENAALNEINEGIQYEIDEGRNELSLPKDDLYYEKKAREKLNLRLPEEIVFYNDLVN